MLDEEPNSKKFMTVFERIEHEELNVDDIVRMNGVAKVCKAKSIQRTVEEAPDNDLITEKIPKWRVSLNEARKCTDPIATQIMFIWDDIPIEESRPKIFEMALDREELQTTTDRISMWLDNTNVSQNDSLNMDENLYAEFNPEPTSTQKRTRSKKRPRIAGF
jgi:hypothetical protein